MNGTGFPVQFPQAPVMPQVRLSQGNGGWAPAQRQHPARRLRPAGPTNMAPLGQGEAELVARGSDIAFSILAGVAAIVSGVAVMVTFGKGDTGAAPRDPRAQFAPRAGARGSKPVWYVVGGIVSLLGAANIWSSINRAAALHPTVVMAPPTDQNATTTTSPQ